MSESKRDRRSTKNPRSNPYRVRLNDEESELVEKLVRETGMNVSDVFRSGIVALEREVESEK